MKENIGRNKVNVTCDNCGESEVVSGDYKEINAELKQQGWKIYCDDGEWLDFCCYDCCREYKE